MKIEVRNVKVAKFASQETLCFEAKIVINDKVVGTVTNAGHGGCNEYHPWSIHDTLTAHAKTLPDITRYTPALRMTADLVIDFLGQDFLAAKDFKKTIASRVRRQGRPDEEAAEGNGRPRGRTELRRSAQRHPGAEPLARGRGPGHLEEQGEERVGVRRGRG